MLVDVEVVEQESFATSRSGGRRWRSAALLAALVAVGMGLAACGSGSPKVSREPGDLRLFAVGLFESGRVSVGGGDGGEVLGVHALARGHRLS